MTWLLSNPTILAILAGFIGALGWGFKQRLAGAAAERNKQRAKDADAWGTTIHGLVSPHLI